MFHQQESGIQALADHLAKQAGLVGSFGQATPQMVRFMQLVASRCLDVLHGPTTADERYAEIARMFGAASAVDATRSDISCRAVLRDAAQLSASERALAEAVFCEVMRQKIGGAEALFQQHRAWIADPRSEGGKRWREAADMALLLTLERLEHAGAARPGLDEVREARFEMEFIHAVG